MITLGLYNSIITTCSLIWNLKKKWLIESTLSEADTVGYTHLGSHSKHQRKQDRQQCKQHHQYHRQIEVSEIRWLWLLLLSFHWAFSSSPLASSLTSFRSYLIFLFFLYRIKSLFFHHEPTLFSLFLFLFFILLIFAFAVIIGDSIRPLLLEPSSFCSTR